MRLLLLLFLLPFSCFAQKWIDSAIDRHPIEKKQAWFTQPEAQVTTDAASAQQYLIQHISHLQEANAGLILEHEISSRAGMHYSFAQTLNGRKVYRGSVKLNVSSDGKVLSLFDHSFPISGAESDAFPDHAAYRDGLLVHYQTPSNGQIHSYELSERYFWLDNKLEPAIHLEVLESSDRYYELVLNSDVKVVYQNDLLSYSAPAPETDSTVAMWVFLPDPLTTANQAYGAPYADSFDQDVLELNAQRTLVQAPVTFENDTFFLRNDHVSLEEFSFPDVEPVTNTTPVFNYTRAQSGFEDVNVFYHIHSYQQYIQSLGFNNIVNYPIAVDAHALNGSDNSNFNAGFNPPRLQFGEGGVDDAEDADVIIHEYGHAIMHSAAPGTNNGTERRTLDEAVGDYFASSYSRYLSPNRWQDVFTWDGHNEYWPGRSTVSTDHYPEDLESNIYEDADIWSATLMQIWGDIGRETTDAIMIQAAYSFAEGMTMPQAALLFLQADTLLFGGANFAPIRQRMYDRGLIPWNVGIEDEYNATVPYRVFNSSGFANGSDLRIEALEPFDMKLYNAVGQLLMVDDAENGELQLNGKNLKSGVYILELQFGSTRNAIKLLRH